MNEALGSLSLQQNASEPIELEQIIRVCCDSFDGDPAEPSSKLPDWLFSVAEWLTPDLAELMALFITLFQNEPLEYGQKICSAVGCWIRHFPIHFDANPQLCRLLERLKRLAAADESIPRPLVEELLDISAIPSYAWLRNPSTRNPVSRHVSLCFEQWTADDIATSMSHIDYKALSRVEVAEIKLYMRLGRLSNQTPYLNSSIAVFNCFSGWVQATILSKLTAAERAEVIKKFVHVSKHLYRHNNFNTLMAVIGGITHSNISRLSQTHSLISPEISAQLTEFTQLLSFNNNYAKYRKALRETGQRFKIPIMGVHLKDLISFWHSAGLENFERCRRISERCIGQLAFLLSHFLSVDRTTPNFGDANLDLINTLKVLFDITYDEQELYNLSLKREPKGKDLFVDQQQQQQQQLPPQSQPTVFADWAKGVRREPDPDSVDKHIKHMIDAVFKHYDDDRDGCIRRAQFEQFVANFSFLQPIATSSERNTNDTDLISRAEMHEFFASKMRNNVVLHGHHEWADWHFLAPAICAHCNKLLWMRHGARCTHCAFALHNHCKESAPGECHGRMATNQGQSSSSSLTEAGGALASASSSSSNSTAAAASIPSKTRISAWLNASLSPRFTAIGPTTSHDLLLHHHPHNTSNQQQQQQMMTNGRVDGVGPAINNNSSNNNIINSHGGGGDNSGKRYSKGLRRVRTSSSSTSEGSSSRDGAGMPPYIQSARGGGDERMIQNFGIFRSSFHRLLRKTTGTAAATTSAEDGGGEKEKRKKDRLNSAEKAPTSSTEEKIEPNNSTTSRRMERLQSAIRRGDESNESEVTIPDPQQLQRRTASLASEEVFEEEWAGGHSPIGETGIRE